MTVAENIDYVLYLCRKNSLYLNANTRPKMILFYIQTNS